MLEWQVCEPAPNPFEAITGDRTTYRVYFASCSPKDELGFRTALRDVLDKCLSFAPAEINQRAERLVFYWDIVYGLLTAVYTDESMLRDAMEITKCEFEGLPVSFFDTEMRVDSDDLSTRIRKMLEDLMSQVDLSVLPPNMCVYFSDQDRGSCSPTDYRADVLIKR